MVRTIRTLRPEILDPANRESCTLIGAGNAVGDSIPPWLIFKSFPTENVAEIEADENMRFVKSDTAFSNTEITFDWLHEFNRVSWAKSALLAVPAMASDCERAFSIAKLTVTSQRHTLGPQVIEMLQLLKNWLRSGWVTLGGIFLHRNDQGLRSYLTRIGNSFM